MTKQETEQQLAEAIAVSQRLGAENKQLKQINENLQSANTKLMEDLNSAIERVRYLAEQLKMKIMFMQGLKNILKGSLSN